MRARCSENVGRRRTANATRRDVEELGAAKDCSLPNVGAHVADALLDGVENVLDEARQPERAQTPALRMRGLRHFIGKALDR